MNIRKALILLMSALTLAAGTGCTKQGLRRESSVVLTFSTGELLTRAGDEDVADGGGIAFDNGKPDLFIAIANYSGTVVATYCGEDVTDKVERLTPSSATQISIRFKDIANSGDYTVYAMANTADGLWGAPANSSAWEVINNASDLDALMFTALTGSTLPSVTDRMPLSAKGTLHVNEGLNGQVELELLRCVAKVGFKFKNETNENLTLEGCNVTLKGINPTQGYLFPQTEDATGTARDLVLISSTLDPIPSGATTGLYGDLLVFPSIAPTQSVGSRYLCNISFTVGGQSKSFTDLPIHDKQSRDIPSLGRNQYLQIETRINKGNNVSFNFEVLDWDEKTEDIYFH